MRPISDKLRLLISLAEAISDSQLPESFAIAIVRDQDGLAIMVSDLEIADCSRYPNWFKIRQASQSRGVQKVSG